MTKSGRQRSMSMTRRGFVRAVGAATLLGGRRARADDGPKGRIVFSARLERGGDDFPGLFAVDVETGQWNEIASRAIWARVAPDGKAVAYPRYKPQSRVHDGIWVGDTRGEEGRRIVPDLVSQGFWSPDGTELIVSGYLPREEPNDIRFETWRMKPDGSNRVRLPIPVDEQVWDWSPDGRLLLTAKEGAPKGAKLRRSYLVFTRKADGSGPRRLTEGTEYITHRFAPDSHRVSFALEQDEEKDSGADYSLWMADAGGDELRLILRGSTDQSPFISCWSPDGKWLAVDLYEPMRDEAGKITGWTRHFEIMDTHGQKRRRVELPHTDPMPLDWTKAP